MKERRSYVSTPPWGVSFETTTVSAHGNALQTGVRVGGVVLGVTRVVEGPKVIPHPDGHNGKEFADVEAAQAYALGHGLISPWDGAPSRPPGAVESFFPDLTAYDTDLIDPEEHDG